jgi:hypothetical protein
MTVTNQRVADEPHSRQNAERQPHQVEHHKGAAGAAGEPEQEIDLDHRDGRGQTNQERRPQSRRMSVLAPIQTHNRAGYGCEGEP